MDETSADATHDLLLALAGRLDDDLLAWARELVAVDETPHAMELVTASLVADRIELPGPTRAALIMAGRAVRTELDAAAALPPESLDEPLPHRFEAGPDDEVCEALRGLPARLLVDCRVSLARRLTPAGSAPGPLPHPVVLVEATPGTRTRDVLAYRLADALDRAGIRASVEVLTAGDELPAYHAEALRHARPVRAGAPGTGSTSTGSSIRPGGSGRSSEPSDTVAANGTASAGATAASEPVIGSGAQGSGAQGSGAHGSGGNGSGPNVSQPPPQPVPLRADDRAGLPEQPVAGAQAHLDGPAARLEPAGPGPRPEPHPHSVIDPRPAAGYAQPTVPASNVRSLVPGGDAGVLDRRRDHGPDADADRTPEPSDAPSWSDEHVETPAAALLPHPEQPVRHRYLLERPDDAQPSDDGEPDADQHPTGDAPRPEPGLPGRGRVPGVSHTQPLPIRRAPGDQLANRPPADSAADRSRLGADQAGTRDWPEAGRTVPDPFLGPLSSAPTSADGDLLRPESVARLSASGRELLARLQAEMQQPGGQRAGGLTANGGGNGAGPQKKVDPPDLAG